MELKNYQIKILNQLSLFLNVLTKHRKEKINFFKFQKQQNKETIDPLKTDYCFNAWNETKSLIPIKNDQYFSRKDGLKNEIPNLCFKVPTGGGKTLLAAHALMLINQDYFKKNNGFLLWLVPSETIYRQTLKNLRNKEHEYRKVLDRVSGGKTIIFEKDDPFTKSQVDENLCVMTLMLQSRSRKAKEI